MKSYPFPGNVRELENVLERSYTLCDSGIIDSHDVLLPQSDLSDDSAIVDDDQFQPGELPLDDHLADVERRALVEAIKQTGGNKTAAAELLGLSFRSMRYKLKKYQL